jgi:hypothetical protein
MSAEKMSPQQATISELPPSSSCPSEGASSNASLLKVVDWDGPDDPEKPVNWPRSKKNQILGAVCLMRFTTYVGHLYNPLQHKQLES